MGDTRTVIPYAGNLDEAAARAIVMEAAETYFASRRDMVAPFVDRHFTLKGSASIHRHALGWDIGRVPANLILAPPHVAAKLAAAMARAARRPALAQYLETRPLQFETAVGREVQWLIATEFLELPFTQKGRSSEKDALAEAILATPAVQARLGAALQAVMRHRDEPGFRTRLERALADYAGTRTAAAEITTALFTLGVGATTLHQATPGMISLVPALAAAVTQKAAIASFPLGASVGGLWYGAFPVAASQALVVGVMGALVGLASITAAFAGVLADPVQRRMGLHQRRLRRLVDTLEHQFVAGEGAGFIVRDHYVARLLDFTDLLVAAVKVARG